MASDMGSDIYLIFQARKDGAWKDVPCKYNGHQSGLGEALHAWLATGSDAVGSYTVPPLASPRGLPADFAMVDHVFHPIETVDILPAKNRGYFQSRDLRVLMGQAYFSHFLAYEVAKATPPKTMRTVVLPLQAYRAWNGQGMPEGAVPAPREWKKSPAYAGGQYATPTDIDANTRFVVFAASYDLAGELAWFFALLEKLGKRFGEVRFVFGFA